MRVSRHHLHVPTCTSSVTAAADNTTITLHVNCFYSKTRTACVSHFVPTLITVFLLLNVLCSFSAVASQRVQLLSMPVSKNWSFGKDGKLSRLLWLWAQTSGTAWLYELFNTCNMVAFLALVMDFTWKTSFWHVALWWRLLINNGYVMWRWSEVFLFRPSLRTSDM